MAQVTSDPTPEGHRPHPHSIWSDYSFEETAQGWKLVQDKARHQWNFTPIQDGQDTGHGFSIAESLLQGGGQVSEEVVERLAKKAGFTGDSVKQMIEIYKKESLSTPNPPFTLDEIKNMSLEDYGKARKEILEHFAPVMKHEWQQGAAAMAVGKSNFPTDLVPGVEIEGDPLLACYYCGKQCENEDELDEHEPACNEARLA
jgi:hypothetical protein